MATKLDLFVAEIKAYDYKWFCEIGGQDTLCEIGELREKAGVAPELLEALEEAVEVIHTWHNMDTAKILSKAEHEITWKIYQQQSPEMKRINATIKKAKGEQS